MNNLMQTGVEGYPEKLLELRLSLPIKLTRPPASSSSACPLKLHQLYHRQDLLPQKRRAEFLRLMLGSNTGEAILKALYFLRRIDRANARFMAACISAAEAETVTCVCDGQATPAVTAAYAGVPRGAGGREFTGGYSPSKHSLGAPPACVYFRGR